MLQTLHSLPADSYNQAIFSIEANFKNFSIFVKNIPKGADKNNRKK